MGQQSRDIQIQSNGSYVNDHVAAEAFSKQFAGNFNEKTQPVLTHVPKHDASLASFNCNESDILVALKSCPCSNTSIDGISYKVLKAEAGHIIYPLKSIFQHSFHDGIFPSAWKKAVITPLFKKRVTEVLWIYIDQSVFVRALAKYSKGVHARNLQRS